MQTISKFFWHKYCVLKHEKFDRIEARDDISGVKHKHEFHITE